MASMVPMVSPAETSWPETTLSVTTPAKGAGT
ncbi:Uncharacterised protein [Mycobacteroides abscessus subsp. abscessus]|nr:Uncharacterised protein [Mycobacteroides abscessus subsp. abscessus]